jgi:hypothetical protein
MSFPIVTNDILQTMDTSNPLSLVTIGRIGKKRVFLELLADSTLLIIAKTMVVFISDHG